MYRNIHDIFCLRKNKSQVELYRINNRYELNTVFILILMQFLLQKKKKKEEEEEGKEKKYGGQFPRLISLLYIPLQCNNNFM